MTRIRPEFLAAKLQAIRNGPDANSPGAFAIRENPRLVEMLWFLQSRPSLEAFAEEVVNGYPDRFATRAMMDAGPPQSGNAWSLNQCLPVWKAERVGSRLPYVGVVRSEGKVWQFRDDGGMDTSNPINEAPEFSECDFNTWAEWNIEDRDTPDTLRARTGQDRQAVEFGLRHFNRSFFAERCQKAARRNLPRYLADMCEDKSTPLHGPSYCPELVKLLFDCMDRHAEAALRDMAETEVTRKAFHWLDFAAETKTPVPIIGLSRFGKTKSVSVWCERRPGFARLVTVPGTNRDRDFFAAHADALGLAYTDKTTTTRLKDAVEFILRESGLCVIYDEAQFLIPVSYSKGTPPRRLDWVRCQLIDHGIPCAFFATPQSYRQTLADFANHTGYTMEQWLGRMAPAVTLPEELGGEDLLSVVRHNFPDLPAPLLELIAARAMRSEGYLKNAELLCKYATFLARQRGASKPALCDVEQALQEMLPGAPTAPSTADATLASEPLGRIPAAPLQPAREGTADALQEEPENEFSSLPEARSHARNSSAACLANS